MTSIGIYETLCIVGALYVIFAPRINQPFYRYQLFHPEPYPANDYVIPRFNGISGKNVFFAGTVGRQLHGLFYRHPSSSLTILFNHGNAGNVTNRIGLIELLLKAGASVFIYDYQGYGLSEGKPSVHGICQDALAAFDYLTNEEKIEPDSIVLYGESLGAAVAAHLSTKRPCRALILQSAFSSLRTIALEVLPYLAIYPHWLFPQPSLDTLAILRRKHPPLLIIHGKFDQVVLFHHAEQLFEGAIEPKQILALSNTAHGDINITAPDEYVTTIRHFLLNNQFRPVI